MGRRAIAFSLSCGHLSLEKHFELFSVRMNIRLDIRDLTRRVERYFEDELSKDNYIADLNALFEGRVVSASTKTEEGVFKTVKGRKGRSPTRPDASKSQNVRSVNNEQMTPLKSLKTMKTRMTPESLPKSTTLFALHLQCDCPTRDFFAPSLDLNTANYTTHRNGRLAHRGGGTAILVKNSIPHSFQITTSSVESTTVVIESLPTNITVCSLYNPGIFSQKPRSRPSRVRNRPQCIVVGITTRGTPPGV
ncbi:hypothetical protein TNCV_4178931 [Trichonephila clavipes]|nr:hypothetical protein TNCV_4178931 [Trichonephila clavipes]